MSKLISLNIPESTSASPLRFFKYFYLESNIEIAKKSYLSSIPNVDDEEYEYPVGCCVSVNKEEETWSIEFNEVEFYDDDNWPIYKTINIEYSFRGELEKLIKNQFYKSWLLFNEKLTSDPKIKRKKDLMRNFIVNCLSLLDSLQELKVHQDKKLLERPLRSLIRNCYTKYIDLAPSQKIDNRIGDILQERQSSIDFYQNRGLKSSLVDEISRVKNETGDSLIVFQNEHHKKRMALFLEKDLDKLDEQPINLIGDVGIVSYFLHRVITISGLTLKQADERRYFVINSEKFISNYASTEKYRLTFRKEVQMTMIDDIIDRNTF